ncbi:hypothetical protein OSB04_013974 [Centaurea solstitialis]|uniref:Pentatricopeptide repeat-containing protein n=1 Tax=Centaurea solstitialis TaxID=347529 RepID=A0AA38TQX3_9ASTR|nr:hypothetical protein OSB04_013974 [Centaurea solstitialis]
MYANYGQLEKSKHIFNRMTEKDIISWNVMMSGYGMMEQSNAKPNELTFLALLSACSHAGLVDGGKSLFGRMGYYSLKPTLTHYACMGNLLGMSEDLVLSMALIVLDGGLWGAFLCACKTHNNPEMGIKIAKRAIECEPENDGYYVTISNLYDSIGMWEEAEWTRNLMKERGVEKAVDWSAV